MNKEMSEIIDGVFFEKLSLMLANVQKWEKQKEEVLFELYGHHIESKKIRL